jgi:hypothetical protein
MRYSTPLGRFLSITQPFATFPPCGGTVLLACIRHAASVNPGPGSNPQIVSQSALASRKDDPARHLFMSVTKCQKASGFQSHFEFQIHHTVHPKLRQERRRTNDLYSNYFPNFAQRLGKKPVNLWMSRSDAKLSLRSPV